MLASRLCKNIEGDPAKPGLAATTCWRTHVLARSDLLTIEGDYYKQAGGVEIELGGDFNGGGDKSLTEFDWLDVTGNVELAGTLEVYLIDSFELLAGMSFDILKIGGTLTGQFERLGEGSRVGTFTRTNLFISYAGGDGNDVTLYSRAVPEPAALLLVSLGSGALAAPQATVG